MIYTEMQNTPRAGRPNETRSRQALEAASRHLEGSARALAHPEPDYREALKLSLQSIRQAYAALLEWHGLTPQMDGSIVRLARPAEALASMLRTCLERALPAETLDATFDDPSRPVVELREGVEQSYYTARNTLSVVIGSLPERLTEDAIYAINRAHAIRIGRFAPAPEEDEAGRSPVAPPHRAARSHPVVVA